MRTELFAAALGVESPWSVAKVDFNQARKLLTIIIDFKPGSRFAVAGAAGAHPVHDTTTKTYRHLNFFQHECHLEVRVPRVKLPDGSVRLVEPPFAGKLKGFTLLFEALLLMLAQQMPFAAVARIVGESAYRVQAVCERYVALALEAADFSEVTALAIDETSRARGHDYVTIAADPEKRRVLCVVEGKDSAAVLEIAADREVHGCAPEQVGSVSIDMSAAFIKGVTEYLPEARITFDKFHVISHANDAVTRMRRLEQKTEPSLKGMRWSLVKDVSRLRSTETSGLEVVLSQMTSLRTARAWLYKEQLREILDRKQINVVSAMLKRWCTCVMRSKVEPMKAVAQMIREHFDGIVAWAQTRATNGFLEAINGLFQAAKRRARGFTRLSTIRTVIFLIAGKLDFRPINPHAVQPT
jgi:transposase